MALIKCPECGKEISDKASACIRCGYPLHKKDEKILYDVIYKGYTDTRTKNENQIKLIGIVRQLCNMDLSQAKKVIDNPPYVVMKALTKENAEWILATLQPYKCEVEIIETLSATETKDNAKISTYTIAGGSTIVCPHCGSNQVTTEKRGFSIISGFWGSNKTENRCGKCGWKWNP